MIIPRSIKVPCRKSPSWFVLVIMMLNLISDGSLARRMWPLSLNDQHCVSSLKSVCSNCESWLCGRICDWNSDRFFWDLNVNTVDGIVASHFCIPVGWRAPYSILPRPWKVLLIDPGTLYPLSLVKHKHGLRNVYNTMTYTVTTNPSDLAQKIKPSYNLQMIFSPHTLLPLLFAKVKVP